MKIICMCILVIIGFTSPTLATSINCSSSIASSSEQIDSIFQTEYDRSIISRKRSAMKYIIQLKPVSECTKTFARCLEWINDKAHDQEFDFPGGSVFKQILIGVCAGRYQDCVSGNPTESN